MTASPRQPYLSIFLLSGAVLAYEVLLIRLFSIIHWHHFTFMVISLALLGIGASGSVLTVFRASLLRRFDLVYPASILLFGIASIACFQFAQQMPFHADEMLWSWHQLPRLAFTYGVLAFPFFLSGLAIALALVRHDQWITRLYAADLCGAAAGCAAIIVVLLYSDPLDGLRFVAVLGVLTGLLAAVENRMRKGVTLALFVPALITALLLAREMTLSYSPFKPLPQMLRIAGSSVIDQRSGPLGQLVVLENPEIPLRSAPGMSLMTGVEPPSQLALFTDAGQPVAIDQALDPTLDARYLKEMTSALPFAVSVPNRMLVASLGGGAAVTQGLAHGASEIHALALDTGHVQLLRTHSRLASQNLIDHPAVTVFGSDLRTFLSQTQNQYDLIQLELAETLGAGALQANYQITAESLDGLLERLPPDGLLAITGPVSLPPRALLRVTAMLIERLRSQGATGPGARLALIRGLYRGTLLVKNGDFTASELSRITDFATRRGFDTGWRPGMKREDANQFNVLPTPYFFDAINPLLGADPTAFRQSYKYLLDPATDDRPFFGHTLKWRTLIEAFEKRDRGGMALIEWGYVVLLATLLQAVVASLLLILFPVWWRARRDSPQVRTSGTLPFAAYFFSIGLAFMLVEVALIQRLTLLLLHPVFAATTVITVFLFFAGLGSALSKRYLRRYPHRTLITLSITLIGISGIGVLWTIETMWRSVLTYPIEARVVFITAIVIPMATAMGIPFASALDWCARASPARLPWAWAVNGCASVIGAVLAALLGLHLGFSATYLIALSLYVVAAVVSVAMISSGSRVLSGS